MPPSGKAEENERPLSAAGAAAARALADSLANEPIAAVYSSPYPRARQTAEAIAEPHGLDVTIVDDLRERLLSPHPLDHWFTDVRRTWEDFDHALPGGESSRTARERVDRTLAALAARHPGETIVAASHGNLIALALSSRDESVGFEFWEAMAMPALYAIDVA